MRILATLGTMLFAANVYAAPAQIMCEQDGRPFDGTYSSVRVEMNDNDSYDVILHTAWAGFGGTGEKTTVLAKNIKQVAFHDSEAIGAGHKSSREEGESQNSGFEFKKVVETGINAWTGKVETKEYIEISVYSPIVRELREELNIEGARFVQRYSHDDQFSRGCVIDGF